MVKTMHPYNRVVGRSVREHRNRYPYIESRFVRIYRVLIFFLLLISHLFVSILFKRKFDVNVLPYRDTKHQPISDQMVQSQDH